MMRFMQLSFFVFRLLSIFVALFFSSAVEAAAPVWTFTPLTPTTLNISAFETAIVKYTLTNQSKKQHTLTTTPIPGVTQDTSAGNCTNPVTLNYQQSCTLSFVIAGSAMTGNIEGGPIVCEQGGTFLCNRPSAANILHITNLPINTKKAYIGDGSNTLWQCPIDSNGGFSVGCSALTNTTSPGFFISLFGTPHIFSDKTYVYVADQSQQLWQCQIDSNGGIVGGCTALTNSTSPGFMQTVKATFREFSGTQYAYVTDNTNTLWQCPMSGTGKFVGGCTALTNTTAFGGTQTVTFKVFSGITYAYVGDNSHTLWQCPMNITGGFSGDCTALTNTTSPSFQGVINATFHTFSGVTYAYVGERSNAIWQCPMNATGGFSGACTALTNSTTPGFRSTVNASFNTANDVTYAYIGDFSTQIWQCMMTPTGGFDGGCLAIENTTSPGFQSTRGPIFY
ncbi:MAG: hypothetical protein P1U39_03105 [Legionellaceae bacterium]|nr:hypothetical protein [Legionellaceae bacterium]